MNECVSIYLIGFIPCMIAAIVCAIKKDDSAGLLLLASFIPIANFVFGSLIFAYSVACLALWPLEILAEWINKKLGI